MGKLLKFQLREKEPKRRACATCGWELPIKMMFGIVLPKAQVTMMNGEVFQIEQSFMFECPGCGNEFQVTRTLTEEDLRKKK
jgi:predicted RNA-binding Zn-ribbon protein involved in translation (DUF1610 family)